jgi:hypothetical protein
MSRAISRLHQVAPNVFHVTHETDGLQAVGMMMELIDCHSCTPAQQTSHQDRGAVPCSKITIWTSSDRR